MRFVPMFATAAIVALVSASAMAQTSTAQPAAPGQAATGTNATGTMMKKAQATPAQSSISKACSAQADAKNLHGKAREKFRSDCKKNGGKG
jgi:Spy/CpxP family protein refolding chaperone